MSRYRAGWIIHGPLFLLALLGSMILARLISVLIPTEFYFTFQTLFSDRPSRSLTLALLVKSLAPLATGLAIGWVVIGGAGNTVVGVNRVSVRRLRSVWSPTVFLSGFLAAFLSAWPMIVYWDLLSNPEIGHLKAVFLGMYLLYMLGFGYLTLFGFLGAIYLRSHLRVGREKLVSVNELSRVGALWMINSGIASFVIERITK